MVYGRYGDKFGDETRKGRRQEGGGCGYYECLLPLKRWYFPKTRFQVFSHGPWFVFDVQPKFLSGNEKFIGFTLRTSRTSKRNSLCCFENPCFEDSKFTSLVFIQYTDVSLSLEEVKTINQKRLIEHPGLWSTTFFVLLLDRYSIVVVFIHFYLYPHNFQVCV